MFLFQKVIDRSALRQGFQIPVEYHPLLSMLPNGIPVHGGTRKIKVILDGKEYDAQLKNQGFDQGKYDGHADVIQIRYGENSEIANRLRQIFHSSWKYVEAIKAKPENVNRKFTIKIPQNQQEFLAISCTDIPNVFVADCISNSVQMETRTSLSAMDEVTYETFEPREDGNATIEEALALRKVRKLDKSIGDSLKRLYDYRCQMTGKRIGEAYDGLVVEAHHIIPFTESLNNNTSNIIIISPDYHRIIHRTKPEWLPQEKAFRFPNGLIDKIKLNKHL